ncbi:hypothetical protein EJB05_34520 [Eragrostis curvula]|uniref:NB-ARC domain-containing protein n=1 Tax=Eragrostis curvula TaxID=38414 RepID=A0A5J9U5J8_9POAL|nr:hypothetical protein EJB05_34520 [Eragrostis curvula]
MELAVGAMGSLVPKLGELLQDEFVKQMGLRREVESLFRELPMMEAALVEVSKVPPEQLSETDKVWARRVRELSYDMEDAVDNFMVSVATREPSKATAASNVFTKAFKDLARKTKAPLKKLMARHQISDEIRDIKDLSKELSDLRAKYAFNSAAYATNTHDGGVDPRVINLRKNEGRELVGIEEARDDLLRMLTSTHPPDGDGGLDNKGPLKVVSIVGFGGLGKTTLATLVHHQLKAQPSFHCSAFVSVGRDSKVKDILREMLEKLGKPFENYMTSWNTQRFCEELSKFRQGKRYNIVVDDVWEKETWETVKCALPDSDCGSKVIMTTRKFEVGTKANDIYKLKPLSDEKSKELFCIRTSTKNNGIISWLIKS